MEISSSNAIAQAGASAPSRTNPQSTPSYSGDDSAARRDHVDQLIDDARSSDPVAQGNALRQLDALTGDRVATDHLVQGPGASPASGSAAQPAPASTPSPTCSVDVRYTPVALGANHSFVTTTDSNSTQYFRGGPSAGGPSSGASGALGSASSGSQSQSSGSGSSHSSDSSNGSSPGSGRGGPGRNNGPWGPIQTDHGLYRPGTVDWTTNPVAIQHVKTLPGTCDSIDHQLATHADEIDRAQIPYNPLSTNSNAVARQILAESGINPGRPVVWAPGWNTQLPTAP